VYLHKKQTFLLPVVLLTSPVVAGEVSPGQTDAAATVESTSLDALNDVFLNRESIETQVVARRVQIQSTGWAHTRFQQLFDGVPVFEGEASVHVRPDGTVSGVTDKLIRDIQLDTSPALSAEEATEIGH
jgi:Zn-dependent metalloprotease